MDPLTPEPDTTADPTGEAPDPTTLLAERDALRAQLDEANEALHRLERRQRAERLLREAEAIDLEAAHLLTEAAVSAMSEPDVKLAVDDLKRRKPWLFGRRGWGDASAMGPLDDDTADPVHAAAEDARTTGDRRALLRYLRLKRR